MSQHENHNENQHESNLEAWLERATSTHLNEDDYKTLLDDLPDSPEEKQRWISELRIALSLSVSRENLATDVLEKALNAIPKTKSTQRNLSWLKAAAMSMLVFGLLAAVLSLIPESGDQNVENVSIVTVFEASDEETEMVIEEAKMVVVAEKVHEIEEIIVTGDLQETEEIIEIEDMISDQEPPTDNLAMLALAKVPTSKRKISSPPHASHTKESSAPQTFVIQSPTAVAGVRGSPFKKHAMPMQTPLASSMMAHTSSFVPPQINERESHGERYASLPEAGFTLTQDDPKSTFSIDVDTASYSNIRRMLRQQQRPNPDAIRIEEMINHFRYAYPQPNADEPFSVSMSSMATPWNPKSRLVRIGLLGKKDEERPPVNLVFLLDVSGSMHAPDKLPLLKQSLKLLLNALRPSDTVSIVAYAGRTGVVLDPTSAGDRETILTAMQNLQAGGSTAGASGIELAYQLAQRSAVKGVNRVILATDGDFNVGLSDVDELKDFIAKKRATGIELSVLGFGQGNIRDDIMERLAHHGNGNYTYIDSLRQARKALVEELDSNLVTIAKDVKLQVEFNPETVQRFRLIGYENRKLAHRDFDNDKVDAGEIGMGHTVTALYEVIPTEQTTGELLKLHCRHKAPQSDSSLLQTQSLMWNLTTDITQDDAWAAAIATWGQMMRQSKFTTGMNFDDLMKLAKSGKGKDPYGYRAEAIQWMETWQDLGPAKSSDGLPRWDESKR